MTPNNYSINNSIQDFITDKENKIEAWGYTEEPEVKTYDHYLRWIDNNSHGKLDYLADHRKEVRKDLRNFFPEFQSALVFLFPYKVYEQDKGQIANYVLHFNGEDYHYHLPRILDNLGRSLQQEIKDLEYKITCDMHPVLERDLAYRAGLGHFGKSSMLINKKLGTFFMIGSLLLSKKLSINNENKLLEKDPCGKCRRCIDSCPTKAITNERTVNTSRCISSFTIEEFKDCLPPEGYLNADQRIFGCDICQLVCPHNYKHVKNSIKLDSTHNQLNIIREFFLEEDLQTIHTKLQKMSNREYRRVFKGTALERTGRKGMMKNLKYLI
jgi:epoxyqueuosine reductase